MRRFEITTRVELPQTGRRAQAWIPVPAISELDWMEAGESRWTTSAREVGLGTDPVSGAMFLHAVGDGNAGARVIALISTVSTQSRRADLSQMRSVAPSEFGYKSLGAGSPDVTKAQHCRAEVFLDGHGWIAVDQADVRKVMLEEGPGELPLHHPPVVDARAALFGSWEGNWIGYNFAHDVVLPGAEGGPVEFLMYPQAEIDDDRRDALGPGSFAYSITSRELV